MSKAGTNTVSDLLYVSTASLGLPSVADAVERLSECTPNIELSGGGLYDPHLLDKLTTLKRARGLTYLVHGYFPPPQEDFVMNFADGEPRTKNFVNESMRYVTALDAPYYSVHPGFKKKFTYNGKRLIDTGEDYRYGLDNLGAAIEWFTTEHLGAGLALENLYPNDMNPDTCLMMTPDEITWVMERYPAVSLLLDLGHLKVTAKVLGFDLADSVAHLFERFAERIAEIHLSENGGSYDDHLLPDSESEQYAIVVEYAGLIKERRINLTLETRRSTVDEIVAAIALINGPIA